MDIQQNQGSLIREIINKDKWWDILSRFIDVLRINIFVVDVTGRILLPPEESKYGGKLITAKSLGFDLFNEAGVVSMSERFVLQGQYLEFSNRYGLHSFAIPIKVGSIQIIGYMVVSPVILNRRLDSSQYEGLAAQFGVNSKNLVDSVSELRVVSNVMMSSILDLLSEIIKDNIELSVKNEEFDFENSKVLDLGSGTDGILFTLLLLG